MRVLPILCRKTKLWYLWLILSLALLSCAPAVTVIDGDTIRLPSREMVRYIGIDTPERGEPYYQKARRANRDLIEGKEIKLEEDVTDRDRYGRLLRYVYADDTFVNAELVRQGYALVYRRGKFQDNKYYDVLKEAADEAAEERRGIWSLSPPHPKLQQHPNDYYLPETFIRQTSTPLNHLEHLFYTKDCSASGALLSQAGHICYAPRREPEEQPRQSCNEAEVCFKRSIPSVPIAIPSTPHFTSRT